MKSKMAALAGSQIQSPPLDSPPFFPFSFAPARPLLGLLRPERLTTRRPAPQQGGRPLRWRRAAPYAKYPPPPPLRPPGGKGKRVGFKPLPPPAQTPSSFLPGMLLCCCSSRRAPARPEFHPQESRCTRRVQPGAFHRPPPPPRRHACPVAPHTPEAAFPQTGALTSQDRNSCQ